VTAPDAANAEGETVGGLATLYLGNILYALELAAMSLDSQAKHEDASFYRGIGRSLAEAHGRSRGGAPGPGVSTQGR